MKKPWQNHRFATILVTIYLVVYTILHQNSAPLPVLSAMFVLSPFLVIWMAYTIIRYASYNGRELGKDEEWGYQDKNREDLGVF